MLGDSAGRSVLPSTTHHLPVPSQKTAGTSLADRFSRIVSPDVMFWVVVGAVFAPVLARTHADPDLWGHLRFGLDILAGHWPGPIDPYSFTQDVPWINHEWLSETQMAAAYALAGPAGLALLKGILTGIILTLILLVFRRLPVAVGGAVLILAGTGTGAVLPTLRPQLWSLLAFTLLCRMLIGAPRRSWLVFLPVLFAFWANLHGGWIVGAGTLAIWTAGQLIQPKAPRPLLASVALLSALATFLNPYGWRLWMFLATTVRLSRNISEWQPIWTVPFVNWIVWATVVAGTVWIVARGQHRPNPERVVIVTLLAYGSFQVVRLLPFFVVAGVLLLGTTVVVPYTRHPRKALPAATSAAGVAFLLAIITAISATATVVQGRCILMDGVWMADRAAGQVLVASKLQGNMVTWFDWGEYAIWHLSPAVRVSIDGRRETIYSDAVLNAHDQMNAATPDGIRYLQQLSPDYVWLPMEFGALREWLGANGYRIDLQTPRSFIAVRGDRPVLRPLDVPTVSACFPGP